MTYEEELPIFIKMAQDERHVIYAEMDRAKSYQEMAELSQKLKELKSCIIKNIANCGKSIIFPHPR